MKAPIFLFVLAVAAFLVACGGESSERRSNVEITLREWEVVVEPSEVRPGKVVFEVTNSGGRQHQFLVVKSDLPPGQLPISDVLVEEEKLNIAGTIASVRPGETAVLELELFPGKYVLICNLVERAANAPADPHYLNGMASSFLVLDD